jgi:hypothetical protein
MRLEVQVSGPPIGLRQVGSVCPRNFEQTARLLVPYDTGYMSKLYHGCSSRIDQLK